MLPAMDPTESPVHLLNTSLPQQWTQLNRLSFELLSAFFQKWTQSNRLSIERLPVLYKQ
jgi:hypothetical protein